MSENENLALYLLGLIIVAALLTGSENTAWNGLLILIAGTLCAAVLELRVWLHSRAAGRKRKEHKENRARLR
jgi:hypothetical protein